MKISVCVEAIFNGRDFAESMKLAKSAGVDTIEFWRWWDKDLDYVLKAKEEAGVNISSFCTKFESLVDPSMRYKYIEGLKESITAAKKLGCSALIGQVGNEIQGVARTFQHSSLVAGLKECAPLLEESEVTLMLEPLNTMVDHKGYYLYNSAEAFEIIDEVGSPNIKVLFDIYHQQITEGNIIRNITANISKIGHFHAAGNPGRHELNKGEINYPEIVKAIDSTEFDGYLGLEYFPSKEPLESLKEVVALLNK